MKSFFKNKFFFLAALVSTFAYPSILLAQETGIPVPSPSGGSQSTYTLLQKLPGIEAVTTGSVASYLQFIFNFGIGIAIALSVVMIVLGGAQYLSTDAVFQKSEGKKRITSALWGLLLALCSYLIIYTINPNILNLNLEVTQVTGAGARTGRTDVSGLTGLFPAGTTRSYPKYVIEKTSMGRILFSAAFVDEGTHWHVIFNLVASPSGEDEAATRERLRQAGIEINNPNPCTGSQVNGCTTVAGLPTDLIIRALTELKKECQCGLMITGGTEAGHRTHGPGKGIIDLKKNYLKPGETRTLDSYIFNAALNQTPQTFDGAID